MQKVPTRLEKDPIVEATFEYRFKGKAGPVADVLQAAIYSKVKERFPKLARNPLAQIPIHLFDDPSLRYQPRLTLRGPTAAISIGDRAISIICPRPYVGWTKYKPLIVEILGLVAKADVIESDERISLRYINVLPGGDTPEAQFGLVHYRASLGKKPYELSQRLTYTRTEILQDGLISIVELSANGEARTPTELFKGLLLTVDSIYPAPEHLLANPDPHLEKLHRVEKEVFFDVLTTETIESMGPEWD